MKTAEQLIDAARRAAQEKYPDDQSSRQAFLIGWLEKLLTLQMSKASK